MKKLLAFLFVLMIALNAVVLLQEYRVKAACGKTLSAKMAQVDLNDLKPGILPGLLKFKS